jgi:P4 family phage/plasmid primase-like protien
MSTIKNLSLTITSQESILDKITLYELIDINKLNKLITSDLLNIITNPISKNYYSTEKEQLNNYKKIIINNMAKVKYNKTKDIKYGRVIPFKSMGLFSFRKAIRHTLAKETFEDIDIENCHPQLLVQICEANNIKCSYLRKYIDNREKYLQEVCDKYSVNKNEAKNLFIRLLYFGTFKNWINNDNYTETNFIKGFSNELKRIGDIIYKNNPELVNSINERDNKIGSVCSYFLQEYENRILEHIYTYCLDNGYIKDNICVLCADGIMIEKKYYNPKLLSDLSIYIFEKTGFKLNFVNKVMNEDLTNVLDEHQIIDIDIWQVLEDMNHSDMAKLYYRLNPNKYIYSTLLGWFEYNSYNVLIPYHKTVPPSLLSDATNKLQDFIINERNKLIPPIKTNETEFGYEKKMRYYDNCMKLAKKGYINVGNSSYVKNIIDYLSNLYNVDRLDMLLDANEKLLAFDNKLFDYEKCEFRDIKPNDYISKTTKYKLPEKSNENIDYINELLFSIFENKDIVEYWLITTAFSLFGNKLESLYIHTGSGGNGKGLLSSILVKGLGDYMYCADNTFLTSVFRSGQANPTLAKCQGIRYLLVSEPDDGSDDVKFNVDFIKMLTGGDIITTRDLFKSNISYKPQFTPFVQCNNKPKLGKIDNGIKRRLKIINYPLKFVEKPINSNERPIDFSLKEKLNNELYKQFILLLIDKAVEYKNKKIIQPKDVENETNEYFDENDPVKGWLFNYCKITDNDKDRIKTSELYNKYLSDGNTKISMIKFSEYMKQNNIQIKLYAGYKYFIGISIKVFIDNNLVEV